jgi:hypothetical protein
MEDESFFGQEGRYEVYVNNDFIGYKKSHRSDENIYDLEMFLQEQGVYGAEFQWKDEHLNISSEDASEPFGMKEMLQIYLLNP